MLGADEPSESRSGLGRAPQTAAAANLISGNGEDGISLGGAPSTGNQVEGNLIGTDATGAQPLGNARVGVLVSFVTGQAAASQTTIRSNTISGNGVGILLTGSGVTNNTVQSNFIGSNAPGNDKQTITITGNAGV